MSTFPGGDSAKPSVLSFPNQRRLKLVPGASTTALNESLLGPWQGKLSNECDTIMLDNAMGETINQVDYHAGFPWPLIGGESKAAIELMHPCLDNSPVSSWHPSNA